MHWLKTLAVIADMKLLSIPNCIIILIIIISTSIIILLLLLSLFFWYYLNFCVYI